MKLPSLPALRVVLVLLAILCLPPSRLSQAANAAFPFGENVKLRGSLENSRLQIMRQKRAHVAFMGGSITEMEGYRPMVSEILKKRFPEADFTFTNAGIASTCSTTGAFRLASDILAKGPVDLLLVEFAVNDDQDAGHSREECIRGMEGIIRHAREANPNMDIVMTFFVNEAMLETLQKGGTPLTIEAHETVAKHYGVSTINLARQAAEEITAGALTWKQYGGVHPAPHGNAIAARMIDELFNRAWKTPIGEDAALVAHSTPGQPLDSLSYWKARFVDPAQAQLTGGWSLGIPDWKQLAGSKRERFTSIPMLSATQPGAELTLAFEGTSIGAYIVAGPDAGVAEVSVDDSAFQQLDLYHHHSSGLHYPRTVMLATGLKPGSHTLVLRISKDTQSAGHAMRIIQFGVN